MHRFYLTIVLLISLVLAIALAKATYDICSWPTDSELAYIPAATRIFTTPFISDLHHSTLIQFKIMHGKEALVVAIAVLQHLLNDFEGLFPNILVLILATAGSGVLIFLILRRVLNEHAAFLGFILFASSFWSYQYILQGAHQPLVMFHFLLAAFFLLKFDGRGRFYLLSGLALGLMLFSSPTAAIYLPYYLAAYIYQQRLLGGKFLWRDQIKTLALISAGAMAVIILFTIPAPIKNLREFADFLATSRYGNHFQITEKALDTLLPRRGAGVIWIWKYFTLAMPVLFGTYLLSVLYVLKKSLRDRTLLWLILLSLSTPLTVELTQVAQFGRNYFSWLIGMVFLIAFASHIFFKIDHPKKVRKGALALIVSIVITHAVFNYKVFVTDILPSRMATAYMHDWFIAHQDRPHYAYILHPHNVNTANVINRPGAKEFVKFTRINSIRDAKDGYMLIPPHTGKSIFVNCSYHDFNEDQALNQLMASGEFSRFVVASFPTLASSRIWPQEEEYCSHLDLIEGKMTDRKLGQSWIIDLKKLHAEWFNDH